MMKKSKYSGCFEKCVKRKVAIVFVTLILCSVVLLGCSGSDKAVAFSLQEETAENGVATDVGTALSAEGSETGGQSGGCGESANATVEQSSIENANATVEQGSIEIANADNVASKLVSQSGNEVETEDITQVYVHVCGAVVSPGVVEVAVDSRVEDALLAAGGFREDAAIDYVNLAAKVEDGQQVYFPTSEEAEALVSVKGGLVASGTESNLQQTALEKNGKVNINTADVALLCTLPGIGEARAQDIIDYREANGAFQNVEGIMQVPGIKQNAYEKLRDKIAVN